MFYPDEKYIKNKATYIRFMRFTVEKPRKNIATRVSK